MSGFIARTQSNRPASQFTLLQMLTGTAGLAVGLAIWRLPHGKRMDIPLAAVGLAFAWSLIRQALAERQRLNAPGGSNGVQRGGCRLSMIALSGVAMLLLAGISMRALQAGGVAYGKPENIALFFVAEFLPLDVILLAMSMGLILGNPPTAIRRNGSPRRHLYSIFGAMGAWIAILLFAVWATIITMLVCVAVLGIENAASPKFATAGIDPSISHRINRFLSASCLAGVPALLNMALISSLQQSDFRGAYRRFYCVALLFGLAAQAYASWWIISRGIHQLAPPMAEAFWRPTSEIIGAVCALILLASLVISWRSSVAFDPSNPTNGPIRAPYFHESCAAGLLLALIGVGIYVEQAKELNFGTFTSNISERILNSLFGCASHLIVMASIIIGLSQAWSRWRRRSAGVVDRPLTVDGSKLLVLTLAVAAFLVTAGPIFAALGLSFWFSPLTELF